MIVVDTTVLVYAVGEEHPLRAPCRDLIEIAARGEIRATTTVEVLQEFAHVRARRRPRDDAAALARSYAELFAPLLSVEGQDLVAGLRLFERSAVLGAFDAVLASATLRSKATLVSADGAFQDVRGLRLLNPSYPSFIEQLRG